MSSMLRLIVSPIMHGITTARAGASVFPVKTSYFNDFGGIANATTLRSLPGWAAYNSVSATSAERDRWVVQGNAIVRLAGNEDYNPAPGKFIIGRQLATTDQTFRAKLLMIPTSGNSIFIALASTAQNNSLVFMCQNSSGTMQNFTLYKNVGGTLTTLLTQNGNTTPLGRKLLPGDTIEVSVLGRSMHLFVNGLRISPVAGADIDTGGVFTKGLICGFGSGQGVGTSFDDVYMADTVASTSMAATQLFWPGAPWLGGRDIPVSGTYAGDVRALDYRVVENATGTTVKDWSRVITPTIAAGAWSASVFVPMCNATMHPKIRIEVRAANDVDAKSSGSTTAVGICVGSYGQSNSVFRGQGAATTHAVTESYVFAKDAESVWLGGTSTTNTRAQRLATQIVNASNIPCGVFVGGSGSKMIWQLNQRGAGELVLDEMEALCISAKAYGYVAAWLWTQGEAEASQSSLYNETSYRADFDLLMSELRAGSSGGQPASFGICVIGRTTGGHISGTTYGDANWSATRVGLARLVDKPGVYMATNFNDAPMADSLHYTADAYVESGRRAGLSMRKALGYGGYDGRGPIITGAVRSGAVVTLNVDLNGAASIAGSGLTNYDVSVDGFVTTLPISSVAVAGNAIVVTLAADPGAAVKVRSFYGMTYGAPVFAIGTYADGTTIPVEPLYIPLLAA